jgi:SOS response regulatory protein OraA/RecX
VTKQPKGMRRILAYLQYMGVTEAQIKELLEKQGGTWEVTLIRKKG